MMGYNLKMVWAAVYALASKDNPACPAAKEASVVVDILIEDLEDIKNVYGEDSDIYKRAKHMTE